MTVGINYITIDTSSMNTSAMSYDHWQLVVDIIRPRVEAEGIQIVQLGEKNCTPLTGCYMAIGQCNFNQKAYVVKNVCVCSLPLLEDSRPLA